MTDLKKKAFAKIQGIKVTILDLETKMTTEYDSVRRAGEAIGCSPTAILKHEKLQLDKADTKPFRGRYVIVINRK